MPAGSLAFCRALLGCRVSWALNGRKERRISTTPDWEGSQALPSSSEKQLPLVVSVSLNNPTSVLLATQLRREKLKRQGPWESSHSHASWNLADSSTELRLLTGWKTGGCRMKLSGIGSRCSAADMGAGGATPTQQPILIPAAPSPTEIFQARSSASATAVQAVSLTCSLWSPNAFWSRPGKVSGPLLGPISAPAPPPAVVLSNSFECS